MAYEAQFLEKLKHPSLLPVLGVGIDDGQPYLIAEYAPLGSLRARLQRQQPGRPLPVDEALTILSQMGQACLMLTSNRLFTATSRLKMSSFRFANKRPIEDR